MPRSRATQHGSASLVNWRWFVGMKGWSVFSPGLAFHFGGTGPVTDVTPPALCCGLSCHHTNLVDDLPFIRYEEVRNQLKTKGSPEINRTGVPRLNHMIKPTKKKRGRPRKLPEFMVRLGEDQEKWNKWLSSMGYPEHSSSTKEVLEHRLPDVVDEEKRVRPVVGERDGDWSLTLLSETWFAPFVRKKADPILTDDWQHYLQYMDVIAEYLYPNDKGARLKSLALQDARSRSWEPPTEFPAELGTPEDLRRRLAHYELEVRLEFNRREPMIRFVVVPMPPDEDENLDEGDEPRGHWEGLKWFGDPPE